ncbi:MAG: CRISPR-associated endonuclease Cas2 [Methylobacter sp.]|nr:CRISPR-associated endonuclease Cas2 [Methylobacter sp.]
MIKKSWYLLSYDIRHEKRLRKFHYRLSKYALALQKSVFLIEADEPEIQRIIQLVDHYTHSLEDDVRLYPIANPKAIWSAGIQHQAFSGLSVVKTPTKPKTSGFMQLIKPFWRT